MPGDRRDRIQVSVVREGCNAGSFGRPVHTPGFCVLLRKTRMRAGVDRLAGRLRMGSSFFVTSINIGEHLIAPLQLLRWIAITRAIAPRACAPSASRRPDNLLFATARPSKVCGKAILAALAAPVKLAGPGVGIEEFAIFCAPWLAASWPMRLMIYPPVRDEKGPVLAYASRKTPSGPAYSCWPVAEYRRLCFCDICDI